MRTESHTYMRSLVFILFFLCVPDLFAQESHPDFIRAYIDITPNPFEGTVKGQVRYDFKLPSGADSLILDAHNIEFEKVLLNGQPAVFKVENDRIALRAPDDPGDHTLSITYTAYPKQTVYFIGWKDTIPGNEQIWTQGQGKDSSHWVPVVDAMGEKVIFNLSISMDPAFEVVSNGVLVGRNITDSLQRWDFEMKQPMSSYLLAFAVGTFDYLDLKSTSGVPLKLYYPKNAKNKAEWTYRYSREIFDFLESVIDFPYPWGDYKQIPVRDFLYAGMENTGATLFSERYVVDSLGYNDENYVNINAHELAHQWFGNLVTEKDGSHHWLHEGFATFYAYLAEGEIFGSRALHWKLYNTARMLQEMDVQGKGEALRDPKAGSLTFYEKGAWALFILRDQIGAKPFDKGIRRYLREYAYSSVTVQEFLSVMEQETGSDLSEFRNNWLDSSTFPVDQAMAYLKNRESEIGVYHKLYLDFEKGITPDPKSALGYFESTYGAEFQEQLIRLLGTEINRELWENAAKEPSLLVQKALLEVTPEMKPWMLPFLSKWLDAPSYELRENCLFKLWVFEPENRATYLDRTANNGSMEQLRFKQLWWLLASLTTGYKTPVEQQGYLKYLQATTAAGYSWEIRQNAFIMLHQIDAFNHQNIKDLMRATQHHSWQFRKFSRNLLKEQYSRSPEGVDWLELRNAFSRENHPYLYELILEQ